MWILHWTRNWLDVLLVYEDIAIVVKTFVKVALKPKGMILCNTFIVKKSPISQLEFWNSLHMHDDGIAFTLLLCNTLGTRIFFSNILILKLNTPITILHRLWSFFGPCNTLNLTLIHPRWYCITPIRIR
jgi:hypothetical protein